MTFNTQANGSKTGNVLAAGDLFAAVPQLSDALDVDGLSRLSLAFTYTQGGASTITVINTTLEASYDGTVFFPVVVNPDRGTPPNVTLVAGTLDRAVSASDSWAHELDVSAFSVLRASVDTTGAPVSGDLISIEAHGER